MKYFLIIALFFLTATPTLAAKTVKGTVPVVLPLQPAPAGVAPNVSRNIQYAPPSYGNESASGSVNSQGGQTASSPQAGQTVKPGASALVTEGPQKSSGLLGWLAAILALGVFVFVVYKKSKSQ